MTIEFALFFSPEGLALAHRQVAGHWALVGEAALGDDLEAAMAELRSAAEARGLGKGGQGKGKKGEGRVLLVLPDDQVLYTSFTAPAGDPELVAARIAEGLEGMTPYAVADLRYDWRPLEEDRVKVAVVAQETLEEASQFAEAHGFTAGGFAAMPPAERFPGIALFGDDTPELPELESGMAFGGDDWAQQAEAEAEAAAVEAAAEAEAEATAKAEAEAAAKAEAEAEALAQATPAAEPEAAPEGDGRETRDDAEQVHPAEPEAGDAPNGPEAVGEPSSEEEADPPPAPISDPSLHQTITPLADEDDAGTGYAPNPLFEALARSGADAERADDPADDALSAARAPEPQAEAQAEPQAEAVPAPSQAEDTDGATAFEAASLPDTETGAAQAFEPPAPAPASGVEATRGKARAPAAGKGLTAEKPEGPAARPARFSPVAAQRRGAPVDAGGEPPVVPEDTDGAATGATPMLSFGARRGKAGKRPASGAGKSTAGQLVSSRVGRLGFGASTTREDPVLHPDAAPAPRRDSVAAGMAAGATSGAQAKPTSRLAAQLARVRDASKTRERPAPEAPAAVADPAETPLEMEATAARDSAAAPAGDARGTAAMAAAAKGLFRRRGGGDRAESTRSASAPVPAAAADAAGAAAENAFASGLLARKSVEPSGPSFRTGLILTLVLLVLLALIAVWSVLFLPNSPMARLFLGDTAGESAALSLEDAPAAPEAISAPPAMGLRDTGTAAQPEPEVAPEPAPEALAALDSAAATAPATPVQEEAAGPEPGPGQAPATGPPAAEAALADLPDIDAEIELPPLPEEALPSLEETEAIYASDGIWPRTPDRPFFEAFTISDDIYVASIDPEISALDAVALPPAGVNPGEILRRVPPPPPFGAEIDRDARGLVTPTPEGVLSPEGAFVVLGRPPVVAVPRPREIAPPAEPVPDLGVEDAILGTFEPQPRPGDLEETRERQILGGLTVTELAGLRPETRPVSAQEAAARASLFAAPQGTEGVETGADAAPAEDTATDAEPEPEPVITGTALAVAESLMPRSRPGDIEAIVAAAERAPAQVIEARAIAPPPSIPSNADVTRAATERDAIRLRDVNLIGVTGTPSDRRALVRLPSGRFIRVGVGDRLDGGRVAAIGEASLQYVRNGRNITLEIPG